MCIACSLQSSLGSGSSLFHAVDADAIDAPNPSSILGRGFANKPILSVDGAVQQLRTGWGSTWQWDDPVITYEIGTAISSSGIRGSIAPMTPLMQQWAATSFELWDDLIAPSMVQVAGPSVEGDITFGYYSKAAGTSGGTYANIGGFKSTTASPYGGTINNIGAAKAWFDNSWWTQNDDGDMVPGGYGILTYLHEIGHTLGLSHPGRYNGSGTYSVSAEYAQDTRQWTVMSYFDANSDKSGANHAGRYASTPMLHDIAAAQAMYGADMTTRTGDTVYGFNSNAGRSVFDFATNRSPVIAIWDAGGKDTLDTSGFTQTQRIDLSPGSYSDVGGLLQNVAIAHAAVIENAIGGSGRDSIIGNAAANRLVGNAGNDYLAGLGGDDVLLGGAGNDILLPGAGNDWLDGGDGVDVAVYQQKRGSVDVDKTPGSRSVVIKDLATGAVDQLSSLERVEFSDGVLALDVDGAAGQVFRLYRAVLGRMPDQPGLKGNVETVDSGVSIKQMSAHFLQSQEFQTAYGSNLSHDAMVAALYHNVLDRAPDEQGFVGWVNALDAGALDRESVILGFSESAEHVAKLWSSVSDGIWLG
jgi:hypothetical protein